MFKPSTSARLTTGVRRFVALIGIMSAAALSLGQRNYSTSSEIQFLINAYVANDMPSLTLPNHTIYVTSTIRVPIGTKNFVIEGGPNTKFVRAIPGDLTMFRIGDDFTYGLENTQFSPRFVGYDLLPTQLGDGFVDLVSPTATIPSGYVAVVGTDPVNDIVKHAGNSTTYWFKRELTKVVGQTGNRVYLNRPLGREFASGRMFVMQPDNAEVGFWITRNITLRNVEFDGTYHTPPFRTSSVSGKFFQASRGVVLGTTDNCLLSGVTVKGFRNNGILAKFSRSLTLDNCTVADMVGGLRYGIEALACRTVTISGGTYSNLGLPFIFQGGSMDCQVSDVNIPPGSGTLDVGHGTGERNISYHRCIADEFYIANPFWRRGVEGANLYSCSARNRISVYGGADSVYIGGRHASQELTSQSLFLFTGSGGDPIPNEVSYIKNLTVNGCQFRNSGNNGQCMLLNPLEGSVFVVGNWVFDACSFVNPKSGAENGGAAIDLLYCQNSSGNILFDACRIENSNGYVPPIRFGANTDTGAWNVRFEFCSFFNPIAGGLYDTHAVKLFGPNLGQFTFASNAFNGPTLQPMDVINDGSANVVFQ